MVMQSSLSSKGRQEVTLIDKKFAENSSAWLLTYTYIQTKMLLEIAFIYKKIMTKNSSEQQSWVCH